MTRLILPNDAAAIQQVNKATINANFYNDRSILKKRTKKYLDLIAGLDAEHLSSTTGMEALLEAIREEFGSAELSSLPIGIVSKCFLGHPYEVHTLDLSLNQIIKHYKSNEVMAANFERARSVALHNAYAIVEVYPDKLILIRDDGTATKL